MRRIETYVGVQVYEWFFSAQAQYTMTAIAKVCAAMFGTSGLVNGLSCGPTSPATMTVQIGAGEIYQMESLEATVCGTLPANTTNTILKQGIQLGTYTTATFATPTTSGQSINYLIEAQYQDSDISLDPTTGASPVVELFYNSTNPQSPWSGPNDSGNPSNTFRDGIIAYQIKAGAAATTGSQVTPTPDSGWIGLWVITVPYGASSLTSSNIAQYTGAPVLPTGILQSVLTSNLTYGIDAGSANTVQAKFPIPVTTLTDGMDVWVKIAAANTGATTFTPNPGVISASPVVGAAHAALQGGELVPNGRANLVWRADITSWVLIECTGAAIQIAPATASQHAPQMAQVPQIQPIAASVASNALTLSLNPTYLNFRSATLASGTVTPAIISTALSLTVPSGATLGTTAATAAVLAVLAINNGGTVQLGVVNIAGTVSLDEAALISATAISASATSANTVYSSSAVTNCPFRVVGFVTVTEATAGTWATAPSIVSGASVPLQGFGASVQVNGYQKLPNGLIIQWGVLNGTSTANQAVNFPIAFPNGVFCISGTCQNASGPLANFISTGASGNSSFRVTTWGTSGAFASASFQWVAIGY